LDTDVKEYNCAPGYNLLVGYKCVSQEQLNKNECERRKAKARVPAAHPSICDSDKSSCYHDGVAWEECKNMPDMGPHHGFIKSCNLSLGATCCWQNFVTMQPYRLNTYTWGSRTYNYWQRDYNAKNICCPFYEYAEDGSCKSCHGNCYQCNGPAETQCVACHPGFSLATTWTDSPRLRQTSCVADVNDPTADGYDYWKYQVDAQDFSCGYDDSSYYYKYNPYCIPSAIFSYRYGYCEYYKWMETYSLWYAGYGNACKENTNPIEGCYYEKYYSHYQECRNMPNVNNADQCNACQMNDDYSRECSCCTHGYVAAGKAGCCELDEYVVNNRCRACDAGCLACDASGCTACEKSSRVLKNGKCVRKTRQNKHLKSRKKSWAYIRGKTAAVPKSLLKDDESCESIKEEAFKNEMVYQSTSIGQLREYRDLPDRCEALTDETRKYQGCYWDQDEGEWDTCRVGDYMDAGRILACYKRDGKIQVTLCQEGFHFNDRGCCPNTHYYDADNHKCVVCHSSCLTCTGFKETDCSSCRAGLGWTANDLCTVDGTVDKVCKSWSFWNFLNNGCMPYQQWTYDTMNYYVNWLQTRFSEGAAFEIPEFSRRILMWDQCYADGLYQWALTPASEFNWASQNGEAANSIMFPSSDGWRDENLLVSQSLVYPVATGMVWQVSMINWQTDADMDLFTSEILNVKLAEFTGPGQTTARFLIERCKNHDCTDKVGSYMSIPGARENWLVFTTHHTAAQREHVFYLRIYNAATLLNLWSGRLAHTYYKYVNTRFPFRMTSYSEACLVAMFAGSQKFDQQAYYDMRGHVGGSPQRRREAERIAACHEKDIAGDHIHTAPESTETRVCSQAEDRSRSVDKFRASQVKMMRFRYAIHDGTEFTSIRVVNGDVPAGAKVQASVSKRGDTHWDGQFAGLSIVFDGDAVVIYTNLFPEARKNQKLYDFNRKYVEVLIWNKMYCDESQHRMEVSVNSMQHTFVTESRLISYMHLTLDQRKGWIWQASNKQFANWEDLELEFTQQTATYRHQDVTEPTQGWYKVPGSDEYKSCRTGKHTARRGLLYATQCRVFQDEVQPTECAGRMVLKGRAGKSAGCCSNGRFYDESAWACKACGHRCASCESAGAEDCTSCRTGFIFEELKDLKEDARAAKLRQISKGRCVHLDEHDKELEQPDNLNWQCAGKTTTNVCGRCVPNSQAKEEYEQAKALDCRGAMVGLTTADQEEGMSDLKDWEKRLGMQMSQERILAQCGECDQHAKFAALIKIQGTYENHQYDNGGKNDWHYVQISIVLNQENKLRWANRAGPAWTLIYRENKPDLLKVVGSPYTNSWGKHYEAKLERNDDASVSLIRGPWGEKYAREGDSDQFANSQDMLDQYKQELDYT